MIRFFLPAVFFLGLAVAIGNATGAEDTEEQPADAVAETIDAAYQALQNQEYDTAYDLFYSLAEQDNARAQYEIGTLYHRGAGVDADVARAARWYTNAAELGYADAQYRVGNMYMMGEGVPQSDSEAIHWYEKAAQQGHQDAGRNLASLRRISNAKTRQELEQEAASLPPLVVERRPADGSKPAQRGFFKRWFGGDKTTEAVAETATKPAAKPPLTAQASGSATGSTPGSTPSSAPEKAEKKGFFSRLLGNEEQDFAGTQEPARASTEGGAQSPVPLSNSSAVSNYELGMAYALGNILDQDSAKAFEHFTRSAQEGYSPAQYRLGVAYANGEGTVKDPAKAIEWYEKSAGQGYVDAQRSLALIYLDGLQHIAPNKPLALAWYNLLAEDGNQMDTHRRDKLLQELSEQEIGKAGELAAAIRERLDAGS